MKELKDNSNILTGTRESDSRWWDVSWNFLGGCSPVSVGCQNCWAAKMASTRLKNHPLYKGLTKNGKWTGEIRLDASRLEIPLHWRNPRRIFVQDMGDLFLAPFDFIDRVFDVMFRASQHTYLILTKRLPRARLYFEHLDELCYEVGDPICWSDGPNKNIWLGVTCENQKAADERIPILLQIPAAARFVSAEPLLEAIDFQSYCDDINWFVLGCESGVKRRHISFDDFYETMCSIDNPITPVFVKQVEINGQVEHDVTKFPEDLRIREYPRRIQSGK